MNSENEKEDMGLFKTIKEYTEVVKNGIKNRDLIIEGMLAKAAMANNDRENLPDEALAEIIRRRELCENCEENSKNAKINGFNGKPYESNLNYDHCIHCKCPVGGALNVYGKEFALSGKCGREYYNKKHPNDKKELKWESYKTE